jgi:hypothetical protein
MRQATRMLGWTTNIVGLLVLVLMVPIGYSMFSMFMSGQAIGFGEPEFEMGEEGLSLSFPFHVNNTGYFAISDVVITTNISDYKGAFVTGDQVVVPLIPEGSVGREALELELGIDEMLSEELNHLLIQDSELSVDVSARFTYAHLVTFGIQLPNQTFPWGAPLHNLSFGEPTSPTSYNGTHYSVSLPMSFESNLPLNLGTLRLELLNDKRERISKTTVEEGAPMGGYSELEMFIKGQDLDKLTEKGHIRLYFTISGVAYGPVEVPYG